MHALDEMLAPLVRPLLADVPRQGNAWTTYSRAIEMARRLPLVHRTNKLGAETSWLDILRTRTFAADEPRSGDRETAAGIPSAAYFFLGCGAYPDGLVAFVLDTASVLAAPASYSPFDTGSIEKHAIPEDPVARAAWDAPAKDRFVAAHVGNGGDLTDFAGAYVAAHFRDPMDYVRLGQWSVPHYPAYHGLQSTTGDRRAWTIEVQVHSDVPFGPGGVMLTEIVAARPALVEDLPEDLKRFARVAVVENEVLAAVAEGIAARIHAEVP